MTPDDFIKKHLPYTVKDNGEITFLERDLQVLIQNRIKNKTFFLLPVPDEVRIPVKGVSEFRSDLETPTHRYEVKRWLTPEKIKEAVGGLHLYHGHGRRILGCLSKRWVVIGLAPTDLSAYKSAKNLAQAYKRLGVDVVFVNEDPKWDEQNIEIKQIRFAFGVGAIAVLVAGLIGYGAIAGVRAVSQNVTPVQQNQ